MTTKARGRRDGGAIDHEGDARRVLDAICEGGLAVIPTDVGYALVSATTEGIEKGFRAKRRRRDKFHAITGSPAIHETLHVVGERARRVLEIVTGVCDLPLGTVAPVRADHPLIATLAPVVREQTVKDGTLAMLMNAGPFLEALARLALERGRLVIGSSANVTLRGVKFRVEDIEPEILEAADVVVDHGLMRWACYGRSSTMLDIETLEVVRYGACYDLIRDALARHLGLDLPAEPVPGASGASREAEDRR